MSIDPDPQEKMNVENVHPQPEINEQMLMSNEEKSDVERSNISSAQVRSLSQGKINQLRRLLGNIDINVLLRM